MRSLSTIISEKSNAIPEREFAIVPGPRKVDETEMPASSDNSLADYVLRTMKEYSLTFPDVEKNARRRGGKIGKSTVQQMAQGKTPNPGIFTLVELAWGLGRPVEEVIRVTLGTPLVESSLFLKSEWANLADLCGQLPSSEQKFVKRFLQMLEREIRRLLSS